MTIKQRRATKLLDDYYLVGEKPSKERNKNGRMALPMKFKLHEVTRNRCLPDDVALYTAPQPAEQQPAPDVAGLVEALRSILGWRELRSGNEFPVERIEEIARAALAAHCEQGGGQ